MVPIDAGLSPLPITVLVQTKNEEIGIAACISALSSFDEIIVVDSDSIDGTKEIALAHGAKVVNFTWNGRYPKKKQWQIDTLETKHDWILFLDADESPSRDLVNELRELQELWNDNHNSDIVAFDILLDYVFSGRLLRHGHRVKKRVLLKRSQVSFPVVDDLDLPGMGELEGHYQPRAHGLVAQLKSTIVHNDLDPVRTWFDRHNRYSDWEAGLRVRSDARSKVAAAKTAKGRFFDHMPFKPIVFFIYAYLLRAGFIDGRAGLDYALALSTYYWQIALKVRELKRESRS